MQACVDRAVARCDADCNGRVQPENHAGAMALTMLQGHIGEKVNPLDRSTRVRTALVDVKVDAVVEQVDLDVLHVVTVEMQLNVGKGGCSAVQDCADEARFKLPHPLHQRQRVAPEGGQKGSVFGTTEQAQVTPEFFFDLIVVG